MTITLSTTASLPASFAATPAVAAAGASLLPDAVLPAPGTTALPLFAQFLGLGLATLPEAVADAGIDAGTGDTDTDGDTVTTPDQAPQTPQSIQSDQTLASMNMTLPLMMMAPPAPVLLPPVAAQSPSSAAGDIMQVGALATASPTTVAAGAAVVVAGNSDAATNTIAATPATVSANVTQVVTAEASAVVTSISAASVAITPRTNDKTVATDTVAPRPMVAAAAATSNGGDSSINIAIPVKTAPAKPAPVPAAAQAFDNGAVDDAAPAINNSLARDAAQAANNSPARDGALAQAAASALNAPATPRVTPASGNAGRTAKIDTQSTTLAGAGAALAQTLHDVSTSTVPAPVTAPATTSAAQTAAASQPAVTAETDGAAQDRSATAGNGVQASGWNAIQPAGTTSAAADTVKLSGPPQQWQQPLNQALGDRLQVQLQNNTQHATIRLDPPMLGRVDISITHSAGALQVNLSASHGEVLRQLQTIGEGMRQDLSQRQYTDVAVTVTATPRSAAAQGQGFTDGDSRQRQSGREQDDNEPGRALSEAGQLASTFALNERE